MAYPRGGGGARGRVQPLIAKKLPKIGKKGDHENQGKEEKSGRKGTN